MSTNYYLINKKDAEIKQSLSGLIELQVQEFKDKLLSFGEKHGLSDFHEDVEEKFNTISNDLDYGLFEPEEIHICKTSDKLIWQVNQCFEDIKSFKEFYKRNKDNYYIENEYEERLTLEEFIKKITWKNQKTEYEDRDFC